MIKLFVKHLLYGVAWGCFLFVLYVVLYDSFDIKAIPYFLDKPTVHAVSFVALGIGFVGGSIVYEIERLRFVLKLIIHLVAGLGVFMFVVLANGWLSAAHPSAIVSNVVFNALILFAVWIVSYIRDKKEVQEINKMITEKNSMKPLDTEYRPIK